MISLEGQREGSAPEGGKEAGDQVGAYRAASGLPLSESMGMQCMFDGAVKGASEASRAAPARWCAFRVCKAAGTSVELDVSAGAPTEGPAQAPAHGPTQHLLATAVARTPATSALNSVCVETSANPRVNLLPHGCRVVANAERPACEPCVANWDKRSLCSFRAGPVALPPYAHSAGAIDALLR